MRPPTRTPAAAAVRTGRRAMRRTRQRMTSARSRTPRVSRGSALPRNAARALARGDHRPHRRPQLANCAASTASKAGCPELRRPPGRRAPASLRVAAGRPDAVATQRWRARCERRGGGSPGGGGGSLCCTGGPCFCLCQTRDRKRDICYQLVAQLRLEARLANALRNRDPAFLCLGLKARAIIHSGVYRWQRRTTRPAAERAARVRYGAEIAFPPSV